MPHICYCGLTSSNPLYTGARLAVQSQNLLFRITDSVNSDRLPRSRNLKLAKGSYSDDAIEVATEKTVSKKLLLSFCQLFILYLGITLFKKITLVQWFVKRDGYVWILVRVDACVS